jgi:hypothetical protein
MCCWLVIAFAFAPRAALVLMALFTDRISAAFGGIFVPLVGFFLLPWATLVFTLLAPGGISTVDLVLIIVALAADLGAYGGGWRTRKA